MPGNQKYGYFCKKAGSLSLDEGKKTDLGRAGLVRLLTGCLVMIGVFIPHQLLAKECRLTSKTPSIQAVSLYKDKSGSVVSRENRKKNRLSLASLRQDLKYLADQIDTGEYGCAARLLSDWSKKRAFTGKFRKHARKRHRIRVATALNIAALKLAEANHRVDRKTTRWLRDVTYRVIRNYSNRNLRRGRSNLQVWAGVASATYLLHTDDKEFRNFQDSVWSDAVGKISKKGYVRRELERASRALLYHQYHFSALLMLATIRSALGDQPGKKQQRAMNRMANRIIDGVCDPKRFVANAPKNLPRQQKVKPGSFKIMHLFGSYRTRARLSRCGQRIKKFDDEFFTGDIRELPILLSHVQ